MSAVVPGLPKSPQDVAETADTVIEQQLSNLPPEPVRTRQWTRCPVFHKGKTYKKTKLIDVSLTNNEMRALLCGKQFEKYRDHCARIATQYDQVRLLKETLQPHTEATVQMDYSENWAAKYPDEISAAYYNSDQTTLHPMVVHYHNEDNTLKWKSYVGVSSVGQHSVPTHYAFMVKLMEQLKVLLPDLEVLHFITDGPANQYRNRTIAALVAVFEQLHGIRATWTWLEGGHGKGPCDGIGGGLKRKLDNLVKGGVVMRDVDELISAVNTPDLNMILIKVKPEEVEELRVQISKWTTSPIKGIMDKHACVAVQGGVSVRDVSCFAPCCRTSPTCNGWKTIPINVTGDILESSSEGSSCESSDAEENAAENAEQNAEQNVPHSTDEDDVPLAKPKAKSNAKSKTRSKTKAKSKGNVQVETEVEKGQSTDDEYVPHSTDEDDVPLAKPKAKSNAKSKTRSKTKAKSKGNVQVETEVEKGQSTDDEYVPHSTDEDDVPLAKPKAKSNAKSKTRSKTKAKSKGNVQVETEVEKGQSTDDEYVPHSTDEDDVPLAKPKAKSNAKSKTRSKTKAKSKGNVQVETEVEKEQSTDDEYVPHSTDEDDVPLAKPKAKSNAKSKTRSKTKAKSKGNVQVETEVEKRQSTDDEYVPHSTDEDDVPLAKPKAKSNAKSKTRSKTKAKSKGNVQVETEVEKEQSTDDEYAPHSTDEDDVPLAKPKAKSNAKSKTRSKTKAKSKGNVQVETEVGKEQSTDEDDVPLAKLFPRHTHVSNSKAKSNPKSKTKSKANAQVEKEVENAVTIGDYITVLYNNK